jgi:hypothetical protein
LDDFASLFVVERSFSVPASDQTKAHSFKQDEDMREDKHASLSKNNDWPNTEIPFSVKLNVHPNKDVILGISLKDLV